MLISVQYLSCPKGVGRESDTVKEVYMGAHGMIFFTFLCV